MPRALDPSEEAEPASSPDSDCDSTVSTAHDHFHRRPPECSSRPNLTSRCYHTQNCSCALKNLVVVVPSPNFTIDPRQPANLLGARDRLSQGILMPLFPSVSFLSSTQKIPVHISRCLANSMPLHASSISLTLWAFPYIAKSSPMELQCRLAYRSILGSTYAVFFLPSDQIPVPRKW